MTIYTIGHSNRSLDSFIKLLKRYKVKVVVDVRRFPSSSKYPHFNKEVLQTILPKNGIDYIWLGKLLGGYRKGGYEKYMETEEYAKGINQLLEVVSRYNSGEVAIMCCEKLWFKCHRRFISNTLVSLGYRVLHIIDDHTVYKHKLRKKVKEVSSKQ